MAFAIPKPHILDRYVAMEVTIPTLLGVGLLTFALVTARMIKLIEMVVNHGVAMREVLTIVGLIMPAFLEMTFPMAVLLGVLMGFGRMSGDQEMTAARACGVSLYRLAIPVMFVAAVAYILASWFAFSIRPWAGATLTHKLIALSQTRSSAGLKEKIFNNNIPGMVVYVDAMSGQDDSMSGVMISDARDPHQTSTIIAKRGIVVPGASGGAMTLRLYDGSIFGVEDQAGTSHVTAFRVYDLSVPADEAATGRAAGAGEMAYSALIARIRDARGGGHPDYVAETERAAKFTIPLATMLVAFIGIPLGLKPARGGHSERFGVAVALFFVYYAMVRSAESLAQRGYINAWIAMSIPDLVFLAFAWRLFSRAATDRSDTGRGPGDIMWEMVERFGRRPDEA